MGKIEFGHITFVAILTTALGCGGGSQSIGGQGGAGGEAQGGGGGGQTSPSCGPGTKLCGTLCANTDVDPANCGACGNACAAGESCVAGTCSLVCSGGTTTCGNACVNTSNDPAHCGACDNACASGEVCSGGQCSIACAGGTLLCDGACIDTSNNTQHCGGCNTTCGFGQVCSLGQCGVSCFGGTVKCGTSCVDVKTDPQNCGSCGNGCAAGTICSNGQCGLSCFGGTTKCGNVCVDTKSDSANCGACGVVCPAGESCVAGQCQLACPPGTENCNGTCTSTAYDPTNCGMCGNACMAAPNGAAVCNQGACGSVCAAMYADCNAMPADGCEVNTSTSISHCGGCGNACPNLANATTLCNNGSCSLGACNTGFANCDNNPLNGCETNLQSSNANCGMCGIACAAGQVCSAGQCVSSVLCSNGSATDCNVAGTTLISSSAFVDPNPPAGWTQCAGFINTAGDDVAHNFLDNCLNTTRLRVRVLTAQGMVEDDFYVPNNMSSWAAWPNFNYLGGSPTTPVKTYWGSTTFFTNTDGKDACLNVAAPNGTVLGTGNGAIAVIAGGNNNAFEYRVNCNGMALPDRKIALYR